LGNGEFELKSAEILVVGIGNLLLADEGIGIHAVQKLQKIVKGNKVEILDGGTAGFELISYFKERKKIFIIDAFRADQPAGAIVRTTIEDVNFEKGNSFSVHQNGLPELLYHSRRLVPCPQIVLYGIVVRDCHSFCMYLSPEVQASLSPLISMILKEINES
jgi:hydrogenase maturation protease